MGKIFFLLNNLWMKHFSYFRIYSIPIGYYSKFLLIKMIFCCKFDSHVHPKCPALFWGLCNRSPWLRPPSIAAEVGLVRNSFRWPSTGSRRWSWCPAGPHPVVVLPAAGEALQLHSPSFRSKFPTLVFDDRCPPTRWLWKGKTISENEPGNKNKTNF